MQHTELDKIWEKVVRIYGGSCSLPHKFYSKFYHALPIGLREVTSSGTTKVLVWASSKAEKEKLGSFESAYFKFLHVEEKCL